MNKAATEKQFHGPFFLPSVFAHPGSKTDLQGPRRFHPDERNQQPNHPRPRTRSLPARRQRTNATHLSLRQISVQCPTGVRPVQQSGHSGNDASPESVVGLVAISKATHGNSVRPNLPQPEPLFSPTSPSFWLSIGPTSRGHLLPQKSFRKTTIHGYQTTRRAARLRPGQKQNRCRAIFGIDGLMR